MPSLINSQPSGLLGLLGIKALGLNPSQLLDEVRPSVDLLRFYLAGQAVSLVGGTAGIGTVGVFTAAALQPTVGELWWMDRVALVRNAVLPAATSYRLRLGVIDVQSTTAYQISPNAVSIAAGESTYFGWEGPILVPPGFGLAVLCETLALGTATQFNVTARIARLLI